MPSLIPGFEYDIFISYRHNDNRSGWVTEFVKALQEELAATIKEPVSVYFDLNPYDGLLETHNVDKSLEGKLKCLVFIPVLSQTYCDLKSFAWQHEFVAFNKLVKEDSFRRDIKLTNGNVASRILPIKIHDLDAEDKSTIENEIDGALRAIEFIFKSPGVNRPLTSGDKREDNDNKTFYRDQINKVARGVKDLISAMKRPVDSTAPSKPSIAPSAPPTNRKKFSRIVIGLLVIGLFALSIFYMTGGGKTSNDIHASIAVIPFKLIGSDQEGKYFAEGVADALINHLNSIPNLKVRSRTSVEKFANSRKTVAEMGSELNVQYILEGSTQKYKDDIRIIVQLINTKTDEHVWFKEYNEKFDDIFRIQSEIAVNIASELNVKLSGQERQNIQKLPTKSAEAWDLYLRGKAYKRNFWKHMEEQDMQFAIDFFKRSIDIDPGFAHAYVELADAVSGRIPRDSVILLINKAIALDPSLPDSYERLGMNYTWNGETEKGIKLIEKAIELDSAQNFFLSLGRAYSYNEDHSKALSCYAQAFRLEKTDFFSWLLFETGVSYLCVGETKLSEDFIDAAVLLEPDNLTFIDWKAHLQTVTGDYDGVMETVRKSLSVRKDNLGLNILAHAYLLVGDYKKSADAYKQFFSLQNDHLQWWCKDKASYAYALQKLNQKEEASKNLQDAKSCLEKEHGGTTVANYDLAKIYTLLGDKAKAIALLEAWSPSWGGQEFLARDPVFETIHNTEEFKKVEKKLKEEIERQRMEAEDNIRMGKFPKTEGIGN